MNKKVNKKVSAKTTPKTTSKTKKKVASKTKVVEKKNNNNSNRILVGVIALLVVILIAIVVGSSFEEKWVQKGDVVSKGNERYLIGDYYYNYDETISGERKDVVDVNWKVLGVDKDGHLLIVSASNAWNLELGSEDNISEAQDDFVTGVSQINEICQRYGYGEGSAGARSIMFDDIVNTFDIEEKYSNAMDFGGVNLLTDKFIENLFNGIPNCKNKE